MRQVKRGQTTPTQVVIVSGLSAGEKVVTEGGDRLTEGGRILLPGQSRGGHGGHGGGSATASQSADAGGAPGGGYTPSPQMQAARQALRQACAADLQKLCPGQEGREAFMCLRENADHVSAGCKAAFAKMPHRAPGGGGEGGAG
jgi:hypothetical protein